MAALRVRQGCRFYTYGKNAPLTFKVNLSKIRNGHVRRSTSRHGASAGRPEATRQDVGGIACGCGWWKSWTLLHRREEGEEQLLHWRERRGAAAASEGGGRGAAAALEGGGRGAAATSEGGGRGAAATSEGGGGGAAAASEGGERGEEQLLHQREEGEERSSCRIRGRRLPRQPVGTEVRGVVPPGWGGVWEQGERPGE